MADVSWVERFERNTRIVERFGEGVTLRDMAAAEAGVAHSAVVKILDAVGLRAQSRDFRKVRTVQQKLARLDERYRRAIRGEEDVSCEHRRTHPSSCDDCGEPWCGVCVTYHRANTVFECASKLRARIAELESELVTWKGIAKERGDRLAGDRAPASVGTDVGEDRGVDGGLAQRDRTTGKDGAEEPGVSRTRDGEGSRPLRGTEQGASSPQVPGSSPGPTVDSMDPPTSEARARLDADRTAKPKSRLIETRSGRGESETTVAIVPGPADTYVSEDGTRIPLVARASEAWPTSDGALDIAELLQQVGSGYPDWLPDLLRAAHERGQFAERRLSSQRPTEAWIGKPGVPFAKPVPLPGVPTSAHRPEYMHHAKAFVETWIDEDSVEDEEARDEAVYEVESMLSKAYADGYDEHNPCTDYPLQNDSPDYRRGYADGLRATAHLLESK